MQKLDDKILFWIDKHCNNKYMNLFMEFATFLGDFCFVWIIYLIYAYLTGDVKLSKELIIVMLVVNAFNNGLVKAIVRRKRPFEDHPEIKIDIDDPYGSSFPSGHSANGFACAVIISSFYPTFGFIAFIFAFLIAFSRMYLKVHYFSDVVCGSLFGVFIAFLCLGWF